MQTTPPTTIKQTIVSIWGDEFVLIEPMSAQSFKYHFGCWPNARIETMTLAHTFKLAQYVNDDHSTVLDCIVATAQLVSKDLEYKCVCGLNTRQSLNCESKNCKY